jgi:hypothetical protein
VSAITCLAASPITAKYRSEGFEALEAITLRVDADLHLRRVLGRRLVRVLARVEAARGQLIAVRVLRDLSADCAAIISRATESTFSMKGLPSAPMSGSLRGSKVRRPARANAVTI